MLKKRIYQFMTNNFKFSADDPQFRRVFLMNFVLPTIIFILLIFSWVSYTIALYPVLASNLAGLVLACFALYDFHQRDAIFATAIMIVTIEFFNLLTLFWFAGFSNYVLVWIIVIPVTAYFLLGRKTGRIVTIGFSVLVLIFILWHYPAWKLEGYTLVGVLNLGFAYFGLVMITSYYELTMQEALTNLKKKNRELATLMMTDHLTGAYNRIKLDEMLASEIAGSRKKRIILAVLICDIDYFKCVNDKFGHLFGDKILKDLVKVMHQTIRESDICGRWGGEEFMIICPNTSLDGGIHLAEKLRRAVADYSRQLPEPVTISFGVAAFSPGDTDETLIKRADDALYLAKKQGRNRVEYL